MHSNRRCYDSPVMQELRVSAPGRICLFGEHQDYLGLPVIPAAISLRLTVEGKRRNDRWIHVDLPDVNRSETLFLQKEMAYMGPKDYLRSAANVLQRCGFLFSSGFDAAVRSTIPVNAGASSSSAFTVAWTAFLAQMSDRPVDSPGQLARLAYEAEVLEFHEAGGMMDQYSSACGGVIFLDFLPDVTVEPLAADLKTFVLGDSGEPKDTQAILARVKNGVLNIVKQLSAKQPSFSLRTATVDSIAEFKQLLEPDRFQLLRGTVLNHQITREARLLLQANPLDHRRFGEWLSRHQDVLRDIQKISTPKIDRMIDSALKAGALGAKINGSGGGGCMFAYAPDDPETVAKAIEEAGGKATIVTVDRGVIVESSRYSG